MAVLDNQPPFPYYGAKGQLAQWIVSHMPDHKIYVEPFAGSAAVLLAKSECYLEVINDLNGDVANFWRVLRDRPEELTSALAKTPYARDELVYCSEAPPTEDAIERSRRFFVVCSMSFNARTANGGFSASSRTFERKPLTFAKRVDTRLGEVAERIRHVEVENTDALRLINRWNKPGVLLYLDPPYASETRNSNGNYATDNGGSDFHEPLIAAIRDHKGAVMLSGYDSPLYNSLGWRKEVRDVPAHTSSERGARRTECLWINR